MFVTKLKTAAAILLAASLLGAGAGVLAFQAPAAKPADERKTAAPNPAAQADDRSKARAEAKARQDHVKRLLVARVEAVRVEVDVRMKEFLAGRGSQHILIDAARRWLEAQREQGLNQADLVAVLEEHFQRMKQIHEKDEERFNAGRIAVHDFKQAEFARLEAEIWLERAKDK
jgi:hypothetical protein